MKMFFKFNDSIALYRFSALLKAIASTIGGHNITPD